MATIAPTSRVVEPARPDPRARLSLFCFPYAGAGAVIYRDWPRLLPPEIQLLPVHLRGRGGRFIEEPFRQLPELVESLAGELAPHLDRPFAFFGHSMGALISYELSLHLRAAGKPLPLHLVVSGRRAPQLPSVKPPLHGLSEPEFRRELRQLAGTPPEILEHEELMELFTPILRADFAVCETYRFGEAEPLECPISAFGGMEDPDVSREDVSAWRERTRGPFRARMFPGGHFFLNEQRAPLVRAVAEDLLATLAR